MRSSLRFGGSTAAYPPIATVPAGDGRVGPCVTSIVAHTAMRNYTGDEGGSFKFDNQLLISSHRKLLWSKAHGGESYGKVET